LLICLVQKEKEGEKIENKREEKRVCSILFIWLVIFAERRYLNCRTHISCVKDIHFYNGV